ncbi:MAG: tetratricopeptide repeat protein [Bacteroidota bacterium]
MKVIIAGSLEFGTARSFKKALEMYIHRTEVLYKHQLFFKAEDIFNEEEITVNIPRFVKEPIELRWWKNTLSALEYAADFATGGNISMWRLETGKILDQKVIEPKGDKIAIKAFQEGRQIIEVGGKMDDAMESLNRAIEKFKRHAAAYERRGFIHFSRKNYEEAYNDYSACLDITPRNADAYYGRALIHLEHGNLEQAIADLDMATKTSIALQSLYWKARHLKGNCHLTLEQYEKAAFEYRLFTKRNFAAEDPNRKALKDAYFDYGRVLLGLGKYDEALEAIKTSKDIEGQTCSYTKADWQECHDKALAACA